MAIITSFLMPELIIQNFADFIFIILNYFLVFVEL